MLCIVGEIEPVLAQDIDELIRLHAGRVRLQQLSVPSEVQREA